MQENTAANDPPREDLAAPSSMLMYASSPSLRLPARWPGVLAGGAAISHVLLALAMLTRLLGKSLAMELDLFLWPSLFAVAPIGLLCSLAGIALVRRHLSGWVLLLSVLTLPLNAWLSLPLVFGMLFGISGG